MTLTHGDELQPLYNRLEAWFDNLTEEEKKVYLDKTFSETFRETLIIDYESMIIFNRQCFWEEVENLEEVIEWALEILNEWVEENIE